jgi:hypothetical protein
MQYTIYYIPGNHLALPGYAVIIMKKVNLIIEKHASVEERMRGRVRANLFYYNFGSEE